jgi:metal-dependent amidase/aminoacylase/carboxypeptidase family protein
MHGGQAPNAIPSLVELSGTLRATTPAAREVIASELRRLALAIGAAHGVGAVVDLKTGTPPLVNDETAAAWAATAARTVLGTGAVVPFGITNMAGEDFACYLERVRGCFLRVGAREPGGDVRDVHSPRFAPAEEALFIGAAVLAESARVASRSLAK